jgi:molybdopterin-containing oxidoreductase family iron-sulfur binding subunit
MEPEAKKTSGEDVCPGTKKLGKKDFIAARELLASSEGTEYWRSLQELAGDPEFKEQLHREFPKGASEWLDPVSRRGFLKVAGASLALAGMTACTKQPPEAIVPYVRQPEEIIPGKPLFYATAMPFAGYGQPALATSNMGRPTKVDGNPEHPESMGGSDLFMQASIMDLYDPDRGQTVIFNGDYRGYGSFLGAVRGRLAGHAGGNSGLRFLTHNSASPTFGTMMKAIVAKYPGSKWYQYEPVNRDNVRAGAMLAFGADAETHYKLVDADVILAIDADFLNGGFPGQVRLAREYASRRRPVSKEHADTPAVTTLKGQDVSTNREMNRMYVVESWMTVTGGKADHRLPIRASEIEGYVRLIASRLGVAAEGGAQPRDDYGTKFIDALVKDLQGKRGASAVIVGPDCSPATHAIVHAINAALGNVGKTVFYTDPVVVQSTENLNDLRTLVNELRGGQVDMLVIMHGNPVYDAPIDLGFADAIGKVPTVIHYCAYANETTVHAHWHVPASHYLEQWSDIRAHDGTISIIQPLIQSLYDTRGELEFLSAFGDSPDQSGYDILRSAYAQQLPGDFEMSWRRAVHDGFIPNTALPTKTLTAKTGGWPAPPQAMQGTELVIRRDPTIWDGRYSNNGWLQELPKPIIRIGWDNPAWVSPATAEKNKWDDQDVIEIQVSGKTEKAAIYRTPGMPDDSITITLGYGRERAGRVGTGFGFNAYTLRTSSAPYIVTNAKITTTGDKYPLAREQGWNNIEGRHLIRSATVQEFEQDPEFAHGGFEVAEAEEQQKTLTMYDPSEYPYKEHKWGMQIDQGACVGCSACVVACNSENNIAVVGKLETQRGRKMHWLRIDTYYQGDAANPTAYFQPVPCMQCEQAPCEVVCPVGATVHSTEGLNDMVYNRCVGTRYCSNNCPYKVRRFNFLLFQDWNTPQLKMMRNPEVSVRPRGVMEKCTYCVQRITHGRIRAEEENRKVRDGEVQTACQQACPADAIVFGDLNDNTSRVTRMKADPRDYPLLSELDTRPRTTYLAVVRNPNPEIPGSEKAEAR